MEIKLLHAHHCSVMATRKEAHCKSISDCHCSTPDKETGRLGSIPSSDGDEVDIKIKLMRVAVV